MATTQERSEPKSTQRTTTKPNDAKERQTGNRNMKNDSQRASEAGGKAGKNNEVGNRHDVQAQASRGREDTDDTDSDSEDTDTDGEKQGETSSKNGNSRPKGRA